MEKVIDPELKISLILAAVLIIAVFGFTPIKHKYKDNDSVIINGKVIPLVTDDYDNWYLQEKIGTDTLYIPANFENDQDEQ